MRRRPRCCLHHCRDRTGPCGHDGYPPHDATRPGTEATGCAGCTDGSVSSNSSSPKETMHVCPGRGDSACARGGGNARCSLPLRTHRELVRDAAARKRGARNSQLRARSTEESASQTQAPSRRRDQCSPESVQRSSCATTWAPRCSCSTMLNLPATHMSAER